MAVNVELRLGQLTETVTVTGASPIVDTQSVRREVVLNNETLSTLPGHARLRVGAGHRARRSTSAAWPAPARPPRPPRLR
jgi:hypothetical protein